MTWSLTARLYMGESFFAGSLGDFREYCVRGRSAISDDVTERAARIVGEPCHGPRQIGEAAAAAEQAVENRIGEQLQGESEALTPRPARAARRRHGAHLRGSEAQALCMERLAERRRDRRVAVPAHLEHH